MRKTINFLTGNFIPENCAGTNRILAMVKELEKGHKVNIFCITERGKPQKNQKLKFSENIDVYYVDQRYYDGDKFYARAVHELYYAIKLTLKANRFKSDITIATSPQMFIIPAVAVFGRGKRIIDVRDLVWDYIEETSLYRKILKGAITQLMKLTLKRYKHITVTNDHEYQWIEENISKGNITKITNGIEKDTFAKLQTLKNSRDDKFTVTYIGNVGIAQNVKILIDSAKAIPDIQVNIIGEGNRYKMLKAYVHKNKISNVEFFGKVPREKMIDFYQTSSVLFAQLDATFKAAMPSKLYEYASTGLPIIYGGLGVAREFVNGLDNCRTIDPGDTASLIEAIKSYQQSIPDISEKNRLFVEENFIRETQSTKMVDIVDRLI
ncbi:MAG: glycosyltransferase family 4 protein [Epsilonproteobacteria bacterium]|nr:glycosyltransferase family 4 protein [Campylobacterota bacterium]